MGSYYPKGFQKKHILGRGEKKGKWENYKIGLPISI